jgi:hypothetical protein
VSLADAAGELPPSTPIRRGRLSNVWANAGNGDVHDETAAPPSSVMNDRRLMRFPPRPTITDKYSRSRVD